MTNMVERAARAMLTFVEESDEYVYFDADTNTVTLDGSFDFDGMVKAVIDVIPETNEWRKISDDPPAYDQAVFVRTHDGSIMQGVRTTRGFVSNHAHFHIKPDWWMPLPPPPPDGKKTNL